MTSRRSADPYVGPRAGGLDARRHLQAHRRDGRHLRRHRPACASGARRELVRHAGHVAAATDPGQEEVYIPLEGDGTLVAGEEEFVLRPGVAVRVGPEQTRRILPGTGGLRFVALGGRPGAFAAPTWTEIGAAPPVAA